MGLLTKDDVASIQGNLKDAEAAMAQSQDSLDKLQNDLRESFGELNALGNEIAKDQKTVDTEEANIKSYEDIIVSTEKAIKDKNEAIAAAKEAGDAALAKQLDQEKDALNASLSSTKDKRENSSAKLDKAKDSLASNSESYDSIKEKITSIQAEEASVKAELALHTANFNEYSNSSILEQFEKEKQIRKDHVEKTIRNRKRLMPLLKNANTGLDDEMEEFTSDTSVFIEDIKTELGIDEKATEIIKQSIAELNAEYEKKGAEGVFMASKALELSRKSLFDLELAGINKMIKAACYKGETSIKIEQGEITASQIIALNEGGYKVTHTEDINSSGVKSSMFVTIDWGFVASEK